MGQTRKHVVSEVGPPSPAEEVKAEDVGDFGWGPWKFHDVLIPANVGRGYLTVYHQRRALAVYFTISAVGVWIFYNLDHPAIRAAALGLVAPGAGFAAVATKTAVLAVLATITLFALSLVIYIALGGTFVPIAIWIGASVAAGLMAKDTILEPSGWLCPALAYAGIGYLKISSTLAQRTKTSRREERNSWLIEAVRENAANSTPALPPGEREVPLETLRHIQYALERALSPPDDWSYYDVLEQFQSSSLRYQLFSLASALSLYQCHYTPNFHGYLSQATRNTIEKALKKKVVSYWKWEAMLGKLKFQDWNPFKQDNIMVTGYLVAVLGLYAQASGDNTFQKEDCMEFVVTDKKRYKTDYQGLVEAINNNMTTNAFTLYPCEPNWTFPVCNLIGYSGLSMGDNVLGLSNAPTLRNRFERSLEEEFTDIDGTVLSLRSELHGFPVRMVDSLSFDCVVASILPAYWPHIGHRYWAMVRRESIRYDEQGRLQLKVKGAADNLDPGTFRKGPAANSLIALAAGEYGDEKLRQAALQQLDDHYIPDVTRSGSLRSKGLSAMMQGISLMARLVRKGDLTLASRHGPPKVTHRGPLLAQIPFPDVLVAKAFSKDGRELELVLYNGRSAGEFNLRFERLSPRQKYALSGGETVTADSKGSASTNIRVEGRTLVTLSPIT